MESTTVTVTVKHRPTGEITHGVSYIPQGRSIQSMCVLEAKLHRDSEVTYRWSDSSGEQRLVMGR